MVNQLISTEMCKTAEGRGAMLAHSIDKQSSRGKTFSHSSAVVMMGHFAGGCVDGSEREGGEK